jgi:uncharacterized membrane protein
MLNKLVLLVISCYLCPTEKRKRSVSAEELLDKQKRNTLNKKRTKKTLNFYHLKVAS